MAEEIDKPRPFDVRTVRYLVRLMSQHDLSEIDLSEGEQRIRLRRGTSTPLAPAAVAAPVTAAATPSAAPALEKPAKKLFEIKSIGVGTFYAQKEPGSPPYVTEGSRVTPSTVVGQLEAMKVFSEILAECNGVIVDVCIGNKDSVEFNTVLFRVDPIG